MSDVSRKLTLKVPATSANLGPCFDSLGLSLNLYLNVAFEFKPSSEQKLNFVFNFKGYGATTLPTDRSKNLMLKVYDKFISLYSTKTEPGGTLIIDMENNIPLSRGLGSSATAVVAGTLLANWLLEINLPLENLINFVVEEEGHPDNVLPCLLGGIILAYQRDESDSFKVRKSEYLNLNYNNSIKAVVVIPEYELDTELARKALPEKYSGKDVVFNLQRAMYLSHAINQPKLDASAIFHSMKDKVHQPYRFKLVPGLTELIDTFNPTNLPGLLGICLSGAGPSILTLASDNFHNIGTTLTSKLLEVANVKSSYLVLDIVQEGAYSLE